MSTQQKGRLSISATPSEVITSVLLAASSILVMVSASMVWFQEKMTLFGTTLSSINIKGTDLGELSELSEAFGGHSILSRGEYAVALGWMALLISLARFFVPVARRWLAGAVAVVGLIALAVGAEPTVRLTGDDVSLGAGLYLLFIGALVLVIVGIVATFAKRANA